LLVVVVTGGLASILATNGPTRPQPDLTCAHDFAHGLFVATFDQDTVGGPPATNRVFGPPGSGLTVAGSPNTAIVINSAALNSRALQLGRGQLDTNVNALPGKLDGSANNIGRFYVWFKAHGAIVPAQLIAGPTINVLSTTDRLAVSLKLYDSAYHLLHPGSGTTERLGGSYDPRAAHEVLIVLDLDSARYSVCINGTRVSANRPFELTNFGELGRVQFFMTPTITEAFASRYVVDQVRIMK
jgi:hypothetical protein